MAHILFTSLGLAIFIGAFRSFLKYLHSVSSLSKLPPGPFRLPVLGNAPQMPTEEQWKTLSKWSQHYGPVMYLDLLGQPIVVLSTLEACTDLLDRRSAIYSDRPFLPMAELADYTRATPLLPYDTKWKQQRKYLAQEFSPLNIPRYQSFQETEARKLLRSILKDNSVLFPETKLRIATIILRVTYGYYVTSEKDPFYAWPIESMEFFSKMSEPGTYMIDIFPWLKYVPKWMPGATFHRDAERSKLIQTDATWEPYKWNLLNMATRKTLTPNLITSVVSELGDEPSDYDIEQLVWAASSAMGGGFDTNMSTILSFYMLMILNPDIQQKAQAEIDAVVGKDRLPSIADRPHLPYVRRLITEVYRWSPPVPLSIPHATTQDDVYNGLLIPKGSIVIPNVWHMLRNPDAYPNPEKFDPTRYKTDAEMDVVVDSVFGFGRRICPGLHFAQNSIFAIISTALATCDILPPVDANGKEVVPKLEYTAGTIIMPKHFDCRFKARSSEALTLLAASDY